MGEKILLVTGGSSEIGMAAIGALARDFDRVLVHYRKKNETLDELFSAHDNLTGFSADLADEAETQALIDAIRTEGLVPTHMLHLPAKPLALRKYHKTPWDVLEEELHISVRSLDMILTAFLPSMAKAHFGRIAVMLSMAINGMPPKYHADYVVVKEALYGLVKAVAVEYADKGITVNGISPAVVETKFLDGLHASIVEQNAKESPTGRNMTPEEIVSAIRFLLLDAGTSVNGQNLSVTQGR